MDSPEYQRSRERRPEFVGRDARGRELMEFVGSYELGDGTRQMVSFRAHSRGDARERIGMMRQSLIYEGLSADLLPERVR